MPYIDLIRENWFLLEPAFFSMLCMQELRENVRMECPLRTGEGLLEYNTLLLERKNYQQVEELLRVEMIRLYLNHPYERRPEGCSNEVISVASNITIGDGYCFLRKQKLPVQTPEAYHLPLGECYEWYAKQLQQKGNDPSGGEQPQSLRDLSQRWTENELLRQRVKDLIDRTTDWGTMPADLIERIRLIAHPPVSDLQKLKQFKTSVLAEQRQLTRLRPNRRTGFLQMGSRRRFTTRLLVAVDVSGSVSTDQLAYYFSLIDSVFVYGMAQLDIVQFDAELGPIQPYQHRTEIEVKGRGGTNYQPLYDYLSQHSHDYDGVLLLTDGQAPDPVIIPHVHYPRVLRLGTTENKVQYA